MKRKTSKKRTRKAAGKSPAATTAGMFLDRIVEVFFGRAESDVTPPPTLKKLNKHDQL